MAPLLQTFVNNLLLELEAPQQGWQTLLLA